MKTAAVVMETWKVPVFKKHLDAEGYRYTEHSGVSKGTTTLRVKCEWIAELKPVVEAAHGECVNAR